MRDRAPPTMLTRVRALVRRDEINHVVEPLDATLVTLAIWLALAVGVEFLLTLPPMPPAAAAGILQNLGAASF